MRAVAMVLLAVGLAPSPVRAAHDVDVTSVARVFLDQIADRRYVFSVVDTKVPAIVGRAGVLPDGCVPLAEAVAGVRVVAGFTFECANPLTFDDVLDIPWPLAGVVVLATWSDGTRASAYFRGDGRSVPVLMGDLRAGAGTWTRLATRYLAMGGEHILFGIDHLLFVFGLLLLVRGFGPLVMTVTAFTVAHSFTLGLAVLGVVPVAQGPVEAGIALSIILLAREVVTGHRGRRHLVHRWPWVVAFVFGLLHGLGFAGALGEIGLRGSDIPLALLFFNLGVEAGQLAFVGVIVLLGLALKKQAGTLLPRVQPVLGYALGTLATLWFVERLPTMWGA